MAKKIKNKNILIVDDDLSIRNTMQEYINNAGFASQTASTAEEALELIRNQQVCGCHHRHPAAGYGWA